MSSYWESTANMKRFSALEGDRKTDVLVIGGGMTGVLTAYMLKKQGVDCLLLEAEVIANGATKNTTAKITSQHGLIYDKLVREFGVKKAGLYLKANEDALNEYRTICGNIDCDFEQKDNYVYMLDDDGKLVKEMAALKKQGYGAELVNSLPLPFKTAGAVKFPRQAQFHPLKFLNAVSEGLPIFEHSRVRELKKTAGGVTAVADGGNIAAKRVVIATHFPFINKHGAYFLKMYQQRSYVLALENAPELDGMFVDGSGKGLSFRNCPGLLLLGGGGHRTGKRGGGYAELYTVKEKYFPNAEIKYSWAAQDCATLDSVPYIGRYSSCADDMYVAAGYNKWGMTSSMTAAALLCDILTGRENPYEELFRPSRTVLRPQLFSNIAESTIGILTPTVPRCPHLGCALKWNAQERTWDCPCHGSRFTENGELIDNPATGDVKGLK